MAALLAGALLVAAVQIPPVNRLFSLPAFRWVGKISYGIYVYHMLALTSVGKVLGPPSTVTDWAVYAVASAFLTVTMAALSFYYYERGFLRLKARRTRVYSRPA